MTDTSKPTKMNLWPVLTPEEAEKLGVPRSRLVISFPSRKPAVQQPTAGPLPTPTAVRKADRKGGA